MSDSKILRIIATIVICFLLTTGLLDGLIFNAYSINFLKNCLKPNNISERIVQTHKLKTILCLILISWALYFLFRMFNKKFLRSRNIVKNNKSLKTRKSSSSKTLFTCSATFFLIYLGFIISALIIEKVKDDPGRVSFFNFKEQSLSRSQRGLEKLKQILVYPLKSKMKNLSGPKKSYGSLESIPLNILELEYLKIYHFKFRYIKIQVIMFSSVLIILVMIIRNK
jgi:hypothetical protein